MSKHVLVVGASGAVGMPLVRQLVEAGNEVVGTCRNAAHAAGIQNLGASAVVLDVLDRAAVLKVVRDAKPDAIVHQATALADVKFKRNFDRAVGQTLLLRTRGTDNLLAAAADAGVTRIVAQSFAPFIYERAGGPVKTEQDPVDPNPPAGMRESARAIFYLEGAVTGAGGVALRYGGFYGASNDGWAIVVRKGWFPLVGEGTGMMSFIHVEDAAAATVLALEHGRRGIYNVVDDEPAPAREWLPAMAKALGARPPRHFPKWLARAIAGGAITTMLTEARGSSNAKAKSELGWKLRYPSWRQGFVAAYGAERSA
jgi:nucleoside-diphosphate-sugar epimerase